MSAESETTPRPDYNENSVGALAQYYRGQFATDLANQMAYRGSVVIWVLSGIIQPLVSIVIWQAVAESRGGDVGGMTAGQYAAYFMVTMLVSHMTFIWHMWEFEWRITTGYFSPILLRPIHPIHNDISQNLSYKLVGLIGVVPGAILLAVVFNADFSGTGVRDLLAFIPALILAMILRFIVEWTLALAAFWLTRVSSLNNLFDVMFLFLGGQFAPLSVMPDAIQALSFALPFRWSIAFPAEVALGHTTGRDVLIGYGMQALWIGIAVAVLSLTWKRAVRQYSAVGA